jgi:hypothetical protein
MIFLCRYNQVQEDWFIHKLRTGPVNTLQSWIQNEQSDMIY